MTAHPALSLKERVSGDHSETSPHPSPKGEGEAEIVAKIKKEDFY